MNIKTLAKYLLISILTISINSCTNDNTTAQNINAKEKTIPFKLGVDVLQSDNFKILQGKRVGLITNPTGVNSKLQSTIDILHKAENVNLTVLFAPEHGVRGNFWAGSSVSSSVDKKTKLPIFSLYGKNKEPNKKAISNVDVLVYDIQDVGVRSYTYISTMGIVMETAAKYNKEVVILDRPNPLGGERVEGALVQNGFFSFVSRYKIPYVYGLTCGELAMLLNNEGLLKNEAKCKLKVVKMQGWRRSMTFGETKLQWVPTSPHIPTWQTSYYYAATGIIGEIDPNLIGVGYTLPFKTLVTKSINADKLAKVMNDLKLEGIIFRPIYIKPYYMPKKGKELQGVQIHITNFKTVALTDIQFYFLQEAYKLNNNYNPFAGKEKKFRMFDVNCGSDFYRKQLMKTHNYDNIKKQWHSSCKEFKKLSEKYYLY